MTVKQSFEIKEDKYGLVNVVVILSDTYSGLSEAGDETRGLKIKRISRSLADDFLKVNTVLEFEYYEGSFSEVENKTIGLLKNRCFVRVEINGEVMYEGRVGEEYEYEKLSEELKLYKFESRPIVRGLYSEVTVKEVIDKFQLADWLDLYAVGSFGVGKWEGGVYKQIEFKRAEKNFWGHWTVVDTKGIGFVANLMNLNKFLNKFCQKLANVIYEKFGASVNIEIPTKELRGWFYPRTFRVSRDTFWCIEDKSIDTSKRKKIQISSVDTDEAKSFFVDAGLFNFEMHGYKMEKIWTADGGARQNAHIKFLSDRILNLSVEQFFHRVGANFGLRCIIRTNDDVNYEVIYTEAREEVVEGIEILYERRPVVRVSGEKSEQNKYKVHFSYIEDEAWNELALEYFRKDDVEIEPRKYSGYVENKQEGEIELFWGFFPTVMVENDGVKKFVPNTYYVLQQGQKMWEERENVIFNRMLWIRVEKSEQPMIEWLPVWAWQIEEYISGGTWYEKLLDFWKKTKFWLTQYTNEVIRVTSGREIEMEVGGFFKARANGVIDWRLMEVGNVFEYENTKWMIREVEFDFSNWMVRISGVEV